MGVRYPQTTACSAHLIKYCTCVLGMQRRKTFQLAVKINWQSSIRKHSLFPFSNAALLWVFYCILIMNCSERGLFTVHTSMLMAHRMARPYVRLHWDALTCCLMSCRTRANICA